MTQHSPALVAQRFNDCINRHDLDGLTRLMHDEHAFVDQDGNVHQPKAVMVENWREFFRMFPDYRNIFSRVESRKNYAVMLGHAYWSAEKPHDPAIWKATIVDGLVREWRIYADTPENRQLLDIT